MGNVTIFRGNADGWTESTTRLHNISKHLSKDVDMLIKVYSNKPKNRFFKLKIIYEKRKRERSLTRI